VDNDAVQKELEEKCGLGEKIKADVILSPSKEVSLCLTDVVSSSFHASFSSSLSSSYGIIIFYSTNPTKGTQ